MRANGIGLLGRAADAVRTALVAHVPALAILGVFALAYLAVLDDGHLRLGAGISDFLGNLVPVARLILAVALILGLIALLVISDRRETLRRMLRWLATRNWIEILALRAPLGLLLVAGISYFYLSFKINIPYLVPYSWDGFFTTLDRMLFLGQDPWVISHRLMPGIVPTQIFNMIYLLWFFVMKAAIFGVALAPVRHPLRQTFLTAYALNWMIGGALLAILFSSAGPVYMERLTGDATFAPLMQRLDAQAAMVELKTLEAQELLWKGYADPEAVPYGISAFPSMHLAISTLCTLLAFAVSRVLGGLLLAFTVAIQIASVHLGWHYAVDGITGIVLALAFWRLSERIVAWWLARTEPGPAPAAAEPAIAAK